MEYYTLSNGIRLPKIGFGTYKITPDEAKNVVHNALITGYRHIDTATYYMNEREIGEAIRQSGIPREDIFLTSKLWTNANSYDAAINETKNSLERLRTPYLDLLLIHWPTPANSEVWRAMEDMYNDGLVRAIGVSNFKIHHLEELFDSSRIKPMVNQVELHPMFQQNTLRRFCKDNDIQVEAWSPLLRGGLFFDTTLNALASKYDRTISQIVLRFLMQEGISVIPKSTSSYHMAENINIFNFDIEDSDMDRLRAMNKDIRYYRDPDNHGF